jgi:hypothetical protein
MVHKSTLEDEYSKPRPNVEKMIDAMERTLHSRIAFFDDSSKSKTPISDVIKAFPFLKIPKLVSCVYFGHFLYFLALAYFVYLTCYVLINIRLTEILSDFYRFN